MTMRTAAWRPSVCGSGREAILLQLGLPRTVSYTE